MSATARSRMTVEEYLAFTETATERHEFLDGEVYAMSGGTDAHDALSVAVSAELRAALAGKPCEARGPNLRVKSVVTGLYTYADALVVCGPKFEDSRRTTLLNPKIVVEVISQSSEAYDRGDKFAHYRAIASVAEYVLVSTTRPRIEVYVREGAAWVLRVFESGESAPLPSVGLQLSVDAVYRGIELDPATPHPGGVEEGAQEPVGGR